MAVTPPSVEAYLAALAPERRSRLEILRAIVVAAAPEAIEAIAYAMPAYRLAGRFLVSFGAFRHHDSLFPASGFVLERVAGASDYARGRGTFRLPLSAPVPRALVERVVLARLEELRGSARVSTRPPR